MYNQVELDVVDQQQYPLDRDDGNDAEDSLIENARLVGFDDGVISGLDEIVPPHDSVYGSAPRAASMPRGGDTVSNQLTLSFRGQVYVFDDITADKVQEVLLLLGGCEYTPGPNGTEMPYQNPRGFPDYTGRCNDPKRLESLNRFRQKRKERCFEKKIRYSVRHEVALKMQRKKGQFAPRNADGSITSDAVEESGQNDNPPETSCTHCGASSKSTPMMRKGPLGPRTLCNACGLFWANKGTLRSLPKKPVDVAGEVSVSVTGEVAVIGTEDDGDSDSELGIPPTRSQKNVDAFPAVKNSAVQAQL